MPIELLSPSTRTSVYAQKREIKRALFCIVQRSGRTPGAQWDA